MEHKQLMQTNTALKGTTVNDSVYNLNYLQFKPTHFKTLLKIAHISKREILNKFFQIKLFFLRSPLF